MSNVGRLTEPQSAYYRENKIFADAFVPSADAFRTLERSRLQALVERDMPLAWRLHAPDFHLVTPTGVSYSRDQYLSQVETGELKYLRWEPGEITVKLFPEVALLRYRAELEMGSSAAQAKSFACWHTDSYELRGGAWQVVLSQATLIR